MKMRKTVLIFMFLVSFMYSSTLVESGYLRDNAGVPVSGNLPMSFALYSASFGGIPLWSSGLLNIDVVDGVYSVALGTNANPINDTFIISTNDYFLEIVVNGETLNPRQFMSKSLQAVSAQSAGKSAVSDALSNTNISQFSNDSGYITSFGILNTANYAVNAGSAVNATNASDSVLLGGKTASNLNVASALISTTANYLSLMTISQFSNDSGYLTSVATVNTVNYAVSAGSAVSATNASDSVLLGGKTESNLNVASALIATTANYAVVATNADLAGDSVLLGGKAEAALNVATALIATTANTLSLMTISQFSNDSGYLTSVGTVNTVNYAVAATNADIAGDSVLLGGKSEANLNVASALTASTANYSVEASNADSAADSALLGGKAESALNVATALISTTANTLTLMTISQFSNDSGYITSIGIVNTANYAVSASNADIAGDSVLLGGKAESALSVASSLIASTANHAVIASNADSAADSALLGGKAEAALNVASALISTTANTLTSMTISQFSNDSGYITSVGIVNTANYAVNAGSAVNATNASDSALLGGKTEANLNVASALLSTTANYAFTATTANRLFGGSINGTNAILSGTLGVTGQTTMTSVSANGTVSANVFVGSGSKLTNIPLDYYQATSNTTATNTSGTAVLMTGMTLTPGAGTYFVMFNGVGYNTTDVTPIAVSIYSNNVLAVGSVRTFRSRVTAYSNISTSAFVTVAAGQAIEVRWSTTAGTATVFERGLYLIRVR